MEQIGLFTEEFLLRRLSELGDNLEKLNFIDWELFRPKISLLKTIGEQKVEIDFLKKSTSRFTESSLPRG